MPLPLPPCDWRLAIGGGGFGFFRGGIMSLKSFNESRLPLRSVFESCLSFITSPAGCLIFYHGHAPTRPRGGCFCALLSPLRRQLAATVRKLRTVVRFLSCDHNDRNWCQLGGSCLQVANNWYQLWAICPQLAATMAKLATVDVESSYRQNGDNWCSLWQPFAICKRLLAISCH